MNVVKLMNDDLATVTTASGGTGQYYTGNTIFAMLINAGLAKMTYEVTSQTTLHKIDVNRPVRFKVLSAVAQPGLNIELGGTGESFINNSTEKPMKVKVPKNDFIDAQWYTITEGLHDIDSAIFASLGNKTFSYTPFGGNATGSSKPDAISKTFECITIGYCFI